MTSFGPGTFWSRLPGRQRLLGSRSTHQHRSQKLESAFSLQFKLLGPCSLRSLFLGKIVQTKTRHIGIR